MGGTQNNQSNTLYLCGATTACEDLALSVGARALDPGALNGVASGPEGGVEVPADGPQVTATPSAAFSAGSVGLPSAAAAVGAPDPELVPLPAGVGPGPVRLARLLGRGGNNWLRRRSAGSSPAREGATFNQTP